SSSSTVPSTTEIHTPSLHDALPISQKENDMKRLQDKVAIITGAGSGFGSAIARRFAAEGAKVVLADVNVKRLEDELADIGKDALDRKSTRLNSSHVKISYAVFCLKK